jgi:hypothetical protein
LGNIRAGKPFAVVFIQAMPVYDRPEFCEFKPPFPLPELLLEGNNVVFRSGELDNSQPLTPQYRTFAVTTITAPSVQSNGTGLPLHHPSLPPPLV